MHEMVKQQRLESFAPTLFVWCSKFMSSQELFIYFFIGGNTNGVWLLVAPLFPQITLHMAITLADSTSTL